jgi:hypothetical protein
MEQNDKLKTCPVCGVQIEGEVVHFSFGKPGTKKRLKARACQFAKEEGCINDEKGEPKGSDYYSQADLNLTDPYELLRQYEEKE